MRSIVPYKCFLGQYRIILGADTASEVRQMPERCLSRKAGIVRCCLSVSVLQRSKTPYHKPYCQQLLFLFISFFRRVFQFLVAFFVL